MRWTILLLLAFAGHASAQVYRCGNTYQAQPCAGGRQIETSPQVSAGSSPTATVYLCRSYQGHGFWSSKHCNLSKSPTILQRMVSVPAELPWNEKVRLAARLRREADALGHAPAPTPAAVPRQYATQEQNPSVCTGYAQALKNNESAARAGGTAVWMEHLAQERRNIIAQQAAAGCR